MWVFVGLLGVPGITWAQAITQPDLKGFFRFERFGGRVPLGINVVREVDNVLLLAANRELVRSFDSARTWDPVLTALQHKNITAMHVDGGGIVVGTATGGLYRTTNDGLHWERFGTDPRLRNVKAILRYDDGFIVTNNEGACYAMRSSDTTLEVLLLPAPCLDVSVFDGTPWFVCEDGTLLKGSTNQPTRVRTISTDSAFAINRARLVAVNDMLAVVLDRQILVFDNDADSLATWPMPIANWTACIAMSDELLLGGRETGLRTLNLENGATTFVFAGPAAQENISELALSGDSIIVGTSRGKGRCYVVSKHSRQWHALNPSRLSGTFDVTALSCIDGHVYVGTREEGVHKGLVEDPVLIPIHNRYEQSIFNNIEPLGNEILIVAQRVGLWRMKTGSSKPEWFTKTLPSSHEYNATVLGTRVLVGLNFGRVLWSDDDGATWTQSVDSLPTINHMGVVAGVPYISTRLGVYTSNDRGERWMLLPGPFQDAEVLWTAGSADTLFVTSADATFRRIGEQAFSRIMADFTPGTMTRFTTVLLHSGLLFATGAPAVYVSADVGDTWEQREFENANAVVSQFFYKGFYYVFTDRGDLWRSPTP